MKKESSGARVTHEDQDLRSRSRVMKKESFGTRVALMKTKSFEAGAGTTFMKKAP